MSAEAVYRTEADAERASPLSIAGKSREEALALEKCAGRQFLWPTLESVVLRSTDAAAEVPIPLAVICCPFADGTGDTTSLPLSDLGSNEPLRCARCRCYVNPFFRWNGKSRTQLKCNMCGHLVEVPQSLQEDMDCAGNCADADNHPELAFGSVDVTTTASGSGDAGEGGLAGPTEPAICFVIESSAEAVRSGFAQACLGALQRLLLPEGGGSRRERGACTSESGGVPGGMMFSVGEEDSPRCTRRIALVLFDRDVHCFSTTRSGRFQEVTMRDVDAPYVPVSPLAAFVDASDPDARAALAALLEHLQARLHTRAAAGADSFSGPEDGQPEDEEEEVGGVAGGAALRLATEMLSQVGGGDVVMFQASNPSIGVGALTPEVDAGAAGDEPSPPRSPIRSIRSAFTRSQQHASGLDGSCSPRKRGGRSSSKRDEAATARSMHAPPRMQTAFYEDMLSLCISGGVAVSCVTATAHHNRPTCMPPPPPLDVGALQWLPSRTGGDSLHMPVFTMSASPSLDGTLQHWVERMQASAYGCVVKLRTSKGLACKSLLADWPAAASSEDSSAFELPRISPDVSFAFKLQAEEESEVESDQYYRGDDGRRALFAQVAVLYTSGLGERTLRLHTCSIKVVASPRAVYNAVSLAPLMTLLVKEAVVQAVEHTADGKQISRDRLLDFCVQVIAAYHRHCCHGRVPADAMVFSKRLALLPLYVLGARKLLYLATSECMGRQSAEEFLRRLLRMPVHSILSAIYPRVFALPPRAASNTSMVESELPRAGFASKDYLTGGSGEAFLVASCFGTWFYCPRQMEGSRLDDGTPGTPGTPDTRAPSSCGSDTPKDASLGGAPAAEPQRTPEDPAVTRHLELWHHAERLTETLRTALAPLPLWLPLSHLPRLPRKLEDLGVDWNTKIFLSATFVEDEGVTDMAYVQWLRFLYSQIVRQTS